jgi:Flp pilus assembly pilin Flp
VLSVRRFLYSDDGQDVVEYGLLIASVAVGVLLATAAFGNQLQLWLAHLAGTITTTDPVAAGQAWGGSSSAACYMPPGSGHASSTGLSHGDPFHCP